MYKTALLACVAIGIASTANATDCMDAAETQAAMNVCAQQEYQVADAELNTLYHEIRQRVGDDSDKRQLLQDAKRVWITYRDAECAFAGSATAGGSAYAMAYDFCLADMTQTRIETFRAYLACEEGDITCPVPATN